MNYLMYYVTHAFNQTSLFVLRPLYYIVKMQFENIVTRVELKATMLYFSLMTETVFG